VKPTTLSIAVAAACAGAVYAGCDKREGPAYMPGTAATTQTAAEGSAPVEPPASAAALPASQAAAPGPTPTTRPTNKQALTTPEDEQIVELLELMADRAARSPIPKRGAK
jgi:hypothetical protein